MSIFVMKKKTTSESESKTKAAPESKTAPKKSSVSKEIKKDFLVVGLGGSAGGIKALREFFLTMPPNSGMAFAVVLHLSPEHESNLAGIIQSHTSMPVIQVNKSHKVEPNHIYVIPPNRQLEFADGTVRCSEPVEKTGARVAIDVFFRTLAQAYRQNAVCVVMSGTGTDGTLGLKRVKESNGFAIVQDPSDAEYGAMPRSAIQTNLADWILPVRLIPERLIQYRDSSERLHLTDDDDGKVAQRINADESLREIITLLRVRTGHDFSNYKTPTLIRRIARHLQIHNLEDLPAYLKYLREHPGEIQSLLKNLLINVTNFFRDADAFGVLEHEIAPQLFAGKKAKDTVRVWSAGCASGEEAYSIAMILTEYADRLNDPPKIQVFGTDVDEEAISEAREHLYAESIEADVSPERLRRFFIKDGNHYRIKKELRELILFAPHNVLRDPPFSRLDMVMCRNLLIYLNRDTQERLMEIFHFALAHNGFLFLGSSETADGLPNLFAPFDKKHRIYKRRDLPFGALIPPQMPITGKWEASPTVKRTQFAPGRRFSLVDLHYKLIEAIAPPAALISRDFEIQYMSESVGRFLQFKGGEPSNNLLKLVNPDLLPDLRAALFSVQREHKPSRFDRVRAVIEGEEVFVRLTVRPVKQANEPSDFLLVTFEESESPFLRRSDGEEKQQGRVFEADDRMEAFVSRLEEDLRRTKSQLRATIEQHEVSIEELKASNEELQAINEELRSATEELETSKEELQSVNEELTTVNAELKDKIEESARTFSDLQNLMSSTEIATVFLDGNLRIKRYTPAITDIFNVTPSDIGRPLEHFTNTLDYENLTKDAQEVLRSLKTFEREIRDNQNRTFLARILPYRTTDDRTEGVVLNFLDITERKLIERALNQSEQRLRTILESAKDYAIFTLDLDRRVTVWNSGAEAIFGYTEKEILGKPGDILFVPEDRKAGAPEREAEIALTRGSAANERWHLHKDETRFYGSGLTMPLRDGDGNHIGFVTIMRDLTEQKKLEDAKFFLAAIVESSEDSIVTVNFEGEITSWNKSAENLYGYTAREAVGKPLTMLTLPGDLQKVLSNIDDIKHSRKVKIFDTVRVHKDGRELNLEVRLSPVKNAKGRVIAISTVARDITARKASSDALRASESRYRAVVESASDYAIFTLDTNNKVTSWNKGAENIFGWKENEIIGTDGAVLFTPEDREKGAHIKEIETARREGRAADERWHIRKDHTLFFASGLLMTLEGSESGFVKICRDQTEKVKAETALKDKEMLTHLVSIQEDERRRIARDLHDHLGQQLTDLRLRLASLKKDCDNETISQKVEDVQKLADRIDRDVDFLAWELRPAALDDFGLRTTLGNFVREWATYAGIRADYHTHGAARRRLPFEVETNLYRIAQEALNNILKHAKAQNVSVLLERQGDLITLIIEDDGIGFDPKAKKNRTKGMGLVGMSERAKICGGSLEIESVSGKGTTIYARIPVKKT
jgi:two-component system, chemotaxis family, CheB/CheR fusion protein